MTKNDRVRKHSLDRVGNSAISDRLFMGDVIMDFLKRPTFRCSKCGNIFNRSVFSSIFTIYLVAIGQYRRQLLRCPACQKVGICTTVDILSKERLNAALSSDVDVG